MRSDSSIIYNVLLYALISSIGLWLVKKQLNTFSYLNLKTIVALARNPEFIIGFLMYLAGFIYWFAILHRFNLSLAFPMASSSLIILTTLFSVVFLKEELMPWNWFGLVLIISGIILSSYRG
jgi:multidrug transporter EmrE-like cation transporter